MIKNVVSSAARLPLAPVRLTGRITGSLLRKLRGNGADAQPAASGRANGASRSRGKAQPKRASSPTRAKAQPKRASSSKRAKAQPKRASSPTRAKAQPKRASSPTRAKAQPKRASSPTRAKAQPKPTPRPTQLDDATIARKVKATIFEDLDVDTGEVKVNVDEGVVSLGGQVRTPDLINELEARATSVTEVRRVENLLQVLETPASRRTEMPAMQPDMSSSATPSEDRPGGLEETSEETPTPAAAVRTEAFAAAGQGHAASRIGSLGGAAESAAGTPVGDESGSPAGYKAGSPAGYMAGSPVGDEARSPAGDDSGSPAGDESTEQDGPDVAELDQDPAYQPSDPSLRGLKGG